MGGIESEPQPERMGKFSSNRDAALHLLSGAGWANASDGNVAAPTGFFTKMTNEPEDMPEIMDAFAEELAAEGVTDPTALIGRFLLIEDDRGFVNVTDYVLQAQLDYDYRILQEAFGAWDAGGES